MFIVTFPILFYLSIFCRLQLLLALIFDVIWRVLHDTTTRNNALIKGLLSLFPLIFSETSIACVWAYRQGIGFNIWNASRSFDGVSWPDFCHIPTKSPLR